MTKTIGIVVAAVVVLGGAWYVMSMNASGPAAPQGAGDQGAAQNNAGTGTIGSLMAMGGSVMCDVDITGANPGSGTIYVSGGKMRGEFTVAAAGKTMHASMINDGQYIYSWTDMMPQGIKMAVSAGSGTSGSANQGVDASTPVNYTCNAWTADTAKFMAPSDIKFMMMGSAGAY